MLPMPLWIVSILLHVYVGMRIVPALPGGSWLALGFAAVLMVSAAAMPMALLSRRLLEQPWADRFAWAGALAMGLLSSLLVLTVLRDLVLLLAWVVELIVPAWAVPGLAAISAAAVVRLGAAISVIGFVNARRTASVVAVDIPITDLPAALHGFTIVQISDIHVGPTIKRAYMHRIVDVVNRLDADMVAVTGDLVDGSVRQLAQHVAPLALLASRHGTFFVTGNHEYYSGAQAWVAELRRLGVRVLMNEHVVLRHDTAHLLVAGVTDYSAHHFDEAERSDPQRSLKGAPTDVALVKVLLAHQPRSATAASAAGFHLQLSGHTHGGQFMPWNWFVRLQQPFTAGLNRLEQLWVYTSRGTGYWGPPKRFGAPSEITHLRLVAAPG
jgi:uncharacterized protein